MLRVLMMVSVWRNELADVHLLLDDGRRKVSFGLGSALPSATMSAQTVVGAGQAGQDETA